MINAKLLVKGQQLRVNLDRVKDRLPEELLRKLIEHPFGKWCGGYKMVDANAFGLILELEDGTQSWFFEEELEVQQD